MKVYVTRALRLDLDAHGAFARQFTACLRRFARGDWGRVSDEDRMLNHQAQYYGGRVYAKYSTGRGAVIIVTDNAGTPNARTCACYESEA